MLAFSTEIDGIVVNGIDLIRWNADGQIILETAVDRFPPHAPD